MLLTALSHFGHIPIERFFFLQVMPMALFPDETGFVGDCQMSVGIRMDEIISHHQLLELVIHVQGRLCSEKENRIEFCRLLSGVLKNVPTEDDPMEVLWRRVTRMLKTYRESVDTAKKNRKFDRLWSPENNFPLRQKLQLPFQIDPPQVLGN